MKNSKMEKKIIVREHIIIIRVHDKVIRQTDRQEGGDGGLSR